MCTVLGSKLPCASGTCPKQATLCLWHVQHAGGRYAYPVRTDVEAPGRTCQHRKIRSVPFAASTQRRTVASMRALLGREAPASAGPKRGS